MTENPGRDQPNILIVTGDSEAAERVAAELDSAGTVRHVRSLAEANAALKSGDFELVLTRSEDLQALLDSANTQEPALRSKLAAIDAAGQELVNLNAAATAEMDVGERLSLLQEMFLKHCHDLLHFDHLVVRILDPATRKLEPVLAGGMSEDALSVQIYAEEEGNGISGYVAATGTSYISGNVREDPRYIAGLDNAASSLTVPLRLHNDVVGILNVESDRPAHFTDHDRQLAEIFGRYIATALHILRLLVVERHTATEQVAADLNAEVASPLNDIVSKANELLSDMQDPAKKERLRAIIDDVETVKHTVSDIADQPPIVGLTPESAPKDPVLSGKRILVADDEDIIRDTIADVLGKAGAWTTVARDGNEAVALIQSQSFDLVLSDIKMPSKNGYEVFSAVRDNQQQCPVILITGFGYDPNHSIVRASKEGLAGVLFKPFKVDQLLDEVKLALTTPVTS